MKFEKKMETSKFEISDYLDSNEKIAEYLNNVLEDGNDEEVVTAIGMTIIGEENGN